MGERLKRRDSLNKSKGSWGITTNARERRIERGMAEMSRPSSVMLPERRGRRRRRVRRSVLFPLPVRPVIVRCVRAGIRRFMSFKARVAPLSFISFLWCSKK